MVAAGDPVYATDVDTLADQTTGRPLVRLVQQTAQSLTDNTEAAITFGSGSEDIDTHGYHDTSSSNTRVTPGLAGYYQVTGTLVMVARADYATIVARVGKNGSAQAPAGRQGPNATSSARSVTATAMLSANGTTDYFELLGTQDNTANVAQLTSVGGSFASVLEVEYLRPL
jgi:hypothetical protein